jgi:lysophospholipase L1-like esterase
MLALLLAETVCRIFVPGQTNIRFKQDIEELQGLKLDQAVGMVKNDPELFWRLVPRTRLPVESWPFFGIISNGQSLREDHEIALEKPKGQTRILFLGDSCTFGYGVARDQTFVEVAESLIREKYGRPVEFINAGVPGYTAFQGWRYLVTQGLEYQPDLVVLTFGMNEFSSWDDRGDAAHYEALQRMRPPGPLSGSRMAQLAWALLNRPPEAGPGAEKRPRMLPDEFAQTLQNIYSALEEKGIPMLILVWPLRTNTDPNIPDRARTHWQREAGLFGQTHSVQESPPVSGMLDIVPIGIELVREHGAAAIYFDQVHVTAAAHQAIGQAVVEHLAPWLSREATAH